MKLYTVNGFHNLNDLGFHVEMQYYTYLLAIYEDVIMDYDFVELIKYKKTVRL